MTRVEIKEELDLLEKRKATLQKMLYRLDMMICYQNNNFDTLEDYPTNRYNTQEEWLGI